MPSPPPKPATPTYYRPSEVAAILQCSEWWVKEQARNKRIPYSWIAGSYRFTAQHIEDIVLLFERRPTADKADTGAQHTRRSRTTADSQVIQLRARRPQRARRAAS
jgi:Helix-turn-helix domain